MECITKLRRVGGSLMATIPKEVVEMEKLEEGGTIKIEVKKVKKSYLGISKGIGPWKKEYDIEMEGDRDKAYR
ncbi:MAG TPA: AbrB/MazE/SpoVT family DNA-binding domain-containing protein [Candidatus Nanoarchaeia archaeon]|nr:AbrB/MazE/SpoVT family DNA-binding domain-containing protein [Candidatus Nanoarchaeia archaeon]